jgi:hemolysin III
VFRPAVGERLNTVTHACGLLLSLVGSAMLMAQVVTLDDMWRSVSCGVYAFALVGVYANSTLSHSATIPRVKRMFRRLDQAFIYLLIVGSYSPFALTYLRSGWWLAFLALLWVIALLGFLSKVLMAHRVEAVAVWIYVALGWLPILSTPPLLDRVPAAGLWWLLIGGLCYTGGTLFLVNDERINHFHGMWHVCVIAGSICHFYAIWRVVALPG